MKNKKNAFAYKIFGKKVIGALKEEGIMLGTICIVFGVMSTISLVLFGIDKLKAGRGGSRIPEIVLIVFSAFGGLVGMFLGMVCFNHKSNMSHKWYFACTLIVSFLVQVILVLMASGLILL
jgi:uncharacterized membrane protein YsdA (DUF1294 family)